MSQPSVIQPGGMIEVVKPYGRSVKLAVLDAHRVPAQGFSINYPVHQNFRVLRHGQFSIMVLTDRPVDVCLAKDGLLVGAQRCDPLNQSSAAQADNSEVRSKARELSRAPQPFYISTDYNDQPLSFDPDPVHRSVKDRLALQLYGSPPVPVPQPQVQRPQPPEALSTPSLQSIAEAPSNTLCWSPDGPPNHPQPSQNVGDDASTAEHSFAIDAHEGALNHTNEEPLELEDLEAELFDADGQANRWAPSSGLLAIGVRMVQIDIQGEPLMPPDVFDWVLVQLNTFEEHALVRAHLLGRINPLPDDDNDSSTFDLGHGRHPLPGRGDSNRHGSQRFRL